MDRRTRTFIVMTIAILVAGLASFGVYRAVQQRPVREVEVPSTFMVVAAEPLEMGIQLAKSQVKLVPWPARNPVAGSFTNVDPIIGRGLIAPVGENEPITESKLAPVEAGAGLPPAIKPGMRAMSVKVNEVIGVAGFVVPGTKVDVLVTLRQERASMSRVVVSNVQVLTAGTRYDQGEAKKDAKPIPTTVVTLMVSPADAERIALAAGEGQIMLALRNPLDTTVTETTGVRTSDLMGAPSAVQQPPVRARAVVRPTAPRVTRAVAEPAPAAPAPPPVVPATVETIRAGKREREVVR